MNTRTLTAGFLTVFCGAALWRVVKRWTTGNNPSMLALIEPFISDESVDLESASVPTPQPEFVGAKSRAHSAAGQTL